MPWNHQICGLGLAYLAKQIKNIDGSAHQNEAPDINFEVENESGAALPNTGGPGTGLIYLLGIMLTGLAGAGLAMRLRRKAV